MDFEFLDIFRSFSFLYLGWADSGSSFTRRSMGAMAKSTSGHGCSSFGSVCEKRGKGSNTASGMDSSSGLECSENSSSCSWPKF